MALLSSCRPEDHSRADSDAPCCAECTAFAGRPQAAAGHAAVARAEQWLNVSDLCSRPSLQSAAARGGPAGPSSQQHQQQPWGSFRVSCVIPSNGRGASTASFCIAIHCRRPLCSPLSTPYQRRCAVPHLSPPACPFTLRSTAVDLLDGVVMAACQAPTGSNQPHSLLRVRIATQSPPDCAERAHYWPAPQRLTPSLMRHALAVPRAHAAVQNGHPPPSGFQPDSRHPPPRPRCGGATPSLATDLFSPRSAYAAQHVADGTELSGPFVDCRVGGGAGARCSGELVHAGPGELRQQRRRGDAAAARAGVVVRLGARGVASRCVCRELFSAEADACSALYRLRYVERTISGVAVPGGRLRKASAPPPCAAKPARRPQRADRTASL